MANKIGFIILCVIIVHIRPCLATLSDVLCDNDNPTGCNAPH